MAGKYRVRYRSGEFEVEIESTDKGYVDAKLKKLLSAKPVEATLHRKVTKKKKKIGKRGVSEKSKSDDNDTGIDIPQLIAAIHEDEEFEAAEQHILDKAAQLPRILLCFYYADKLSDTPTLSSGQIEKLTDELGKKIGAANAASVIGKNRKYLSADSVLRKGARIRYKINRPGKQAVANLLQGKKLK